MKLYVETTVPNFLFADDAPEKKAVTEQFYDWLKVSLEGGKEKEKGTGIITA